MSLHNDNIESAGSILSDVRPLFDEQVRAIPFSEYQGYPYKIELPNGHITKGCVSENGFLPRVNTGNCGGTYYVYWGDEALAEE